MISLVTAKEKVKQKNKDSDSNIHFFETRLKAVEEINEKIEEMVNFYVIIVSLIYIINHIKLSFLKFRLFLENYMVD